MFYRSNLRQSIVFAITISILFLGHEVPSESVPILYDPLYEISSERGQLEDLDIPLSPRDEALRDALHLLDSRKYDAAIDEAQEALKSAPDSAPAYEILGVALAKKGDIDEGLEALNKAITIDPKRSSAITKIGDIYMAREQYEEAKEAFMRAIEIRPEYRRAHQRLGIIYEKEGEIQQAIEHYEKGLIGTPAGYVGIKVDLGRLYNRSQRFDETVDLLEGLVGNSRNMTAHIVLGTAYLGQRKPDEAIRQFTRAVEAAPDEPGGYLSLAIAYRAKGEYQESLRSIKEVIEREPDWSTGHFQEGETYLEMKQYDNALKSFQKSAELSDSPGLSRLRIAQAYIAQEDYQEAVDTLEDLISSPHRFYEAYELLGTVYQNAMQKKSAERVFSEMCRRYPGNPAAFYRTGLFYGFTMEYDRAIENLQKARSLNPKHPDTVKALSRAYSQKGDNDKAIKAGEDLVEMHPTLSNRLLLASVYEGADRKEEAARIYREILAEEPDQVLALNNLSVILSEQGNLGEALTLARRAVSLVPKNAHIRDSLGWILYQQDYIKESLKELQEAENLSPQNPTILYHLAMAHYKDSTKEEALSKLNQAISISQTFPEYQEAIKMREALLK